MAHPCLIGTITGPPEHKRTDNVSKRSPKIVKWKENPKSTRPSAPLLVRIGRQIPPNTITETISVICKKHWFSLAQTLMAPQPKPRNEAEDCQGSKINIIMAPRDTQKHPKRAKRPHKRPYVRQNDALSHQNGRCGSRTVAKGRTKGACGGLSELTVSELAVPVNCQ